MKASILAIGTELTAGQIINRNAATISQKLKSFGVETQLHLTVPDDRQIILESLKYIENSKPELIFITGGLGPTTDDFTRDMIAQWRGLKMNFDDFSWKHIQERLTSRGFSVREMQKQQCYYPEGSVVLPNSEGTANGFKLKTSQFTVYVLPGPPREIEAVWTQSIAKELQEKTQHINRLVTRAWDTLGQGESDVASLVEGVLKNRPNGLEIGYRVHLPYVEVKLTYRLSEENNWMPWLDKVTEALKDITITRDFQDVAQLFSERVRDLDFTFYDFVTDGFFHLRLASELKKFKNWSFQQGTNVPDADMFTDENNFLALLPFEYDKCILLYSVNNIRNQKVIEAPMKAEIMKERRQQYFAEMALVEIVQRSF